VKINSFIFLITIGLGLVIALLSKELYSFERKMQIKTVTENINRKLFRVEKDIQQVLESNNKDQFQELFDRSTAIDPVIDIISISRDGHHIEFSSSRSLLGSPIQGKYYPLEDLFHGLLDDQVLQYKSDFFYFEGAKKSDVHMFVKINRDYVFGELDKVAIVYGLSFFLIFSLISIVLSIVAQRFILVPLQKLTDHARTKNDENESYYIEELTALDATLANSFRSMLEYQTHLKEALEKTQYLDAILRTVADINQLLISSKNKDELMQESVKKLASHQGYGLCWIGIEKEGVIQIQSASDDNFEMQVLTNINEQNLNDPVFESYVLDKSVIIDHLETIKTDDPWQKLFEKDGFGSFIALPLRSNIHEKQFGVLGLYSFNKNGFEPKEVAMLEELAGDIGFAMSSFQRRQELEYHLTTDAITDLPNRIMLIDRLPQSEDVTLAIINLDRFNDINEIYGVNAGDILLAVYAKWLMTKIDEKIFLCKLSSDEYAILFDKHISFQECKTFIDELIISTAKEKFLINEIEVSLSITVGIATGIERIIEHATAALKRAKVSRQPCEVYVKQSSTLEYENNIIRYKTIKEAIEQSRVIPVFQPIVDNKTGKIMKYEALIRIVNEDKTLMSPFLFLEFAKKTRLYGQLTKIMIQKSFEKLKTSPVPISINLSTEDLLNIELADYIENLILTDQIGSKVIFEILESEGIDNYSQVHSFIERFQALGCRFAIDDFGAGYSNFDHLLKLNIDILKIDASLIKNLPYDKNAQLFVQHINDFTHKIGLETVAEFVSDEAIFEIVKEIGIDFSQGYYFYEPSAELVTQN
jgi:diguanylate cyclase (GGDEF)-like protein